MVVDCTYNDELVQIVDVTTNGANIAITYVQNSMLYTDIKTRTLNSSGASASITEIATSVTSVA